MKFAYLLGLAAVLFGGTLFTASAQDGGDIEYLQVKTPFMNIYAKEGDPKADIIRQTRRGEFLEVLSRGDLWCKVKVDGKNGFVEAKAGRFVKSPGPSIVMILLYIILLGGCAVGAIYYVKKQQKVLTK